MNVERQNLMLTVKNTHPGSGVHTPDLHTISFSGRDDISVVC